MTQCQGGKGGFFGFKIPKKSQKNPEIPKKSQNPKIEKHFSPYE
jgi:hypothetical protein